LRPNTEGRCVQQAAGHLANRLLLQWEEGARFDSRSGDSLQQHLVRQLAVEVERGSEEEEEEVKGGQERVKGVAAEQHDRHPHVVLFSRTRNRLILNEEVR
jgi:hypothetical protein